MVKSSDKNSSELSKSSGDNNESPGKSLSTKAKVEFLRNILFNEKDNLLKKKLKGLANDYNLPDDIFDTFDKDLSSSNLELLFMLLPTIEKIKQKAVNEIGFSKLQKQLEKKEKEVTELEEKLKTVKKALS